MNMLIRDRSLAVQQLVLIHDIKEEKGWREKGSPEELFKRVNKPPMATEKQG